MIHQLKFVVGAKLLLMQTLVFSIEAPVQHISTLEFFLEKEESIDISIYNVLGQQVKFFNSKNPIINGKHKMELDLANLPPGNYILELTSESMKENIKIIKH